MGRLYGRCCLCCFLTLNALGFSIPLASCPRIKKIKMVVTFFFKLFGENLALCKLPRNYSSKVTPKFGWQPQSVNNKDEELLSFLSRRQKRKKMVLTNHQSSHSGVFITSIKFIFEFIRFRFLLTASISIISKVANYSINIKINSYIYIF